MKLVVTAEGARVLTKKVLDHGVDRHALGDEGPKAMPGTAAVRLASLPAALLGRLCGFEEIRVEVDKTEP